jgi:hypothetical protein
MKHWNTTQEDRKLLKIFPESPITAFKKAKNIQDNLVRAKLQKDEDLQILIDLANE